MNNPFVPIKHLELIWRDDLPYSAETGERFYFNNDRVVESEIGYINKNQLISRWQAMSASPNAPFVIAETKFGVGLNLLLSWFHWLEQAPTNARLHYISCDNQPFCKDDLLKILAKWPQFEKQAQLLLNVYPVLTPGFHHFVFEEDRVCLTLMLGEPDDCFQQLLLCGDTKLEKDLRANFVDAWFITSKLSDGLSKSIALLSKPETAHAVFEKSNKNHSKKTTPWHIARQPAVKSKQAIVIGAGLAGCLVAYSLAKRGWRVLLLDSASEAATGASGNPQAVLYPKLSAYSSSLTEFMLSAYLYATRFYATILKDNAIGSLNGILQLAHNSKEAASQQSLFSWLKSNPELGRLVDVHEASLLSGVPQQTGGLYLPLSGWLDCKALCHLLIQTPGIHWIANHDVLKLDYEQGQWFVGAGLQAERVIIANGFQANQFEQTAHLPLKPIAGLLTSITCNDVSKHLKIPLCGDGHILPAKAGGHLLGATYKPGTIIIDKAADDKTNLEKLVNFSDGTLFSSELISNWSGIRAATPDYLPLVGPLPVPDAFQKTFHALSTDAKRWLPVAGDYYPGLYVCAGFGSRGLTTAPLCAEWLASLINNEFSFLPNRFVQSLSASRFLIKKIVKKSD